MDDALRTDFRPVVNGVGSGILRFLNLAEISERDIPESLSSIF